MTLRNEADTGAISLGQDGEFTLALTAEQLSDIVDHKMLTTIFELPENSYSQLSDGNKRALPHLVKAAKILDRVFLRQDHPDNIRAKEAFEKAAGHGNKIIDQSYILFQIFNGLQGPDMYAKKTQPLQIFKDKKLSPGKGFYPHDITREELIEYILAYPEQASAIFGNSTMVVRENGRLKTLPFSVYFHEEMESAAFELMQAAKETDHAGFSTYLKWQAQALVNDSDPEMVFNADKAWVDLEDSPLEFTIARESYDDRLSNDVATDPAVKAMLDLHGIKAKKKDTIGIRVGIVNQDSYATIVGYREHLDTFAALMPLYESYQGERRKDRLTFADVDLISIEGDYAAVRRGLTTAQNLPNGDKLSVQLGNGRRLVFHRQVRQGGDPVRQQNFLDLLVNPSQHEWYDDDADFEFLVGHELVHSIGPGSTLDGRDKKASLGKWGDIIEENKADLGSIVMAGYFVELGKFDQQKANNIYLTWMADQLPSKQPTEDEAHRFRSIMQINYFRENGAIELNVDGRLRINPESMPVIARQMLEEVIQLQLDGDPEAAGTFSKKYGEWNDVLQYVANQKMSLQPRLYEFVIQPVANRVLEI